MKMKKAQTEMLGIAIVVILVSIGILFIVSNAMRSAGQTSQKTEFSEKQLATNILSSILQTSTSCQNDRISTLLIDCGKGNSRTCGGETIQGIYIEQTNNPCDYMKDTITLILNATLKKWNKKYQFLAYREITSLNSQGVNITNRINECLTGTGTGLQYVQKDSYYLPLYPGTMTVELALCS